MLPQSAVQSVVPPRGKQQIFKKQGKRTLCGILESIGATVDYPRNAEIYGEGESAEYVYKVIAGAVRVYKVLDDGRRQISAFYLPGDIFGLAANARYRFSAEAVTHSSLFVVKGGTLKSLAAQDPELANELWSITARELEYIQGLMIMLGRKNAQERVIGFLLEMAARAGGSPFQLPMSRQDIADYLGLTIETVSRNFTQLEKQLMIKLPSSRCVILCNPDTLAKS